ncbi:MAG: helix-turn-helix domain-containing protein [Proteobacteria bacterium]|nr:helix-turn-helix domain-containing protein [Pseudomonadota bacterium]
MQFPQACSPSERVRAISTSNFDELAQFQINKNRRYTQLQPGTFKANYSEVDLGDVQIFRESLTAGARIEATPAYNFVPFAAILPESSVVRYCGRARADDTLIQATGGEWDICFKGHLDYVSAAFDREALNTNIERLLGHELPPEWLVSRACLTNPSALAEYGRGMVAMLQAVQSRPEILSNIATQRMISAAALKLALNALMPTTPLTEKLKPHSLRARGVRRVIDYLHAHAAQLPTIPELCEVAELSERSLEYGFRENMDVTPIRYLRLVRLNGVRRELLAVSTRDVKVADIAMNWGFVEFGRFAGEYRQLFGELPSKTLRCSWRE